MQQSHVDATGSQDEEGWFIYALSMLGLIVGAGIVVIGVGMNTVWGIPGGSMAIIGGGILGILSVILLAWASTED